MTGLPEAVSACCPNHMQSLEGIHIAASVQSSVMRGMFQIWCLVSGHVLVCSRRVVQRFTSLQPEEVSDMWYAANITIAFFENPLA